MDEEGATHYLEEPKVGMCFASIKEAYDYYNGYARMKGFSVRIRRTNKNCANRIQRQVLVWAAEGSYKKIKTPEKKKREERRFDCKAKFVCKLVDGDKYKESFPRVSQALYNQGHNYCAYPAGVYQQCTFPSATSQQCIYPQGSFSQGSHPPYNFMGYLGRSAQFCQNEENK